MKCGKGFRWHTNLKQHMRTMHSDERPFHCKICNKRFKLAIRLRLHLEVHANIRQYLCITCGKSFIRKSGLRKHNMAVHIRDKNYTCPVCNKAFNRKDNLQKHVRLHTNKIDETGRKRKPALRDDNDEDSVDRPFRCALCSKTFKRSAELRRHVTVHTKESKTFECSDCKKIYKSNYHLQRHIAKMHNESGQ